ncbi:hypothetical protein [Ralstonia pseudosolanacearum]|nr:hypothetical protein [Ralstonia pseudosolanacearum]MCL1621621.1 hypothetical protein [Ralstonia pseudosolanacearum CaRs-Mep]
MSQESNGSTAALPRRVNRFLLTALLLMIGLHLFMGWRLLPDLDLNVAGWTASVAFLCVSSLMIPLGMAARLWSGIAEQKWRDLQPDRRHQPLRDLASILTIQSSIATMVAPFARAWSRGAGCAAVVTAASSQLPRSTVARRKPF